MCGIAGWITYQKDIAKENNVQKQMLETLKRRGPNQQGIYTEEHVNLLHARLSIMDPANGKQPMHYQHYTICYNGEIYNTKQIREDLIEKGYRFDGNCDTEVVLKAYVAYGERCLDILNGIFAFAIWDTNKQQLFMARDRLGVKPFFYYLNQEHFLFASQIKTLLVHPLVDAIVDDDGLKELFLLGPARSAGKTPIRDIKELKQGEYAIYDKEGFQVHTYWQLKAKKHKENRSQTQAHLKQLVSACINDQLDSDVGICTFLSGGLDSSIISKIAAQRYPDLQTFSIEYEENEKYFTKSIFQPNRDADFIDIMVNHIHSNHTNVLLTQKEIVSALKEATIARDLPGMAEIDSSLLLFCEEIKKAKSVALSGEGADEILGGYPWYYNDDILWQDEFPWSHSYDIRVSCLKDGLIKDGEQYIKKAYYQSISDVDYLEEDDAKERRMREMFYLNMRWFLQTLLDRKDRMSMYHSLEVRVPFLDYRLCEYAYNMPWRYKSLNGREKGILREAFRDELPDEIINRKKSPYPKTFHPLYTEMLITQIRKILKSDCLLAQILDINKVNHLIDHLDTIDVPWYGQLMKGPQILAYFIQMHFFFETYHVKLQLTH
ncbi:MAG: asparagine synthase (glutamine-hydrolyzing) [Erysipelotrichia bacterium]|nr:asparagine synthase (glutamine-hydrolyzing) [Erysipelotrichia bacterium]NCC53937.1 asparagine synthase (glutamine-hydrolyzing) [Erysipelotrichia bacterium]